MRAREKLEGARWWWTVAEYAPGILEIWWYLQSTSVAGVGQAGLQRCVQIETLTENFLSLLKVSSDQG